jgi:CheY-like chemotaxis protein
VLVVEDNLTNQRVIGLLLGKMGCSVVLAGDGAQAVQLCRHQRFDVVFMDMQMPVMDGLEATRLLRQLPGANARVPIIALTANALEEDRQRCIDAGMSGFLAKPIVRDQLLAALRGSLPAASADSMRSA